MFDQSLDYWKIVVSNGVFYLLSNSLVVDKARKISFFQTVEPYISSLDERDGKSLLQDGSRGIKTGKALILKEIFKRLPGQFESQVEELNHSSAL